MDGSLGQVHERGSLALSPAIMCRDIDLCVDFILPYIITFYSSDLLVFVYISMFFIISFLI
jgi:hypothetical protein